MMPDAEGTALAFPARVMRRSLVIKQVGRAEWHVVIRDFAVRGRHAVPLAPSPDRVRCYSDALLEARAFADRKGYPVLIEPKGEAARPLSDSERRAFDRCYVSPRLSLAEILSKGSRHGR